MRKRVTVDPSFTFGMALIVSLVLWWPTLRSLLAGNVDITDAGLRYLVALGLAWVGLYFLTTLVSGYGHDAPRSPPPTGAEMTPGRRTEDHAEATPTPATADESAA